MKSEPWDSRTILAGFSKETTAASASFIESLKKSFWVELATEYDAENFCSHLRLLKKEGILRTSNLFEKFEQIWRRDELNHTIGFMKIYSELYSIDEAVVTHQLQQREVNFDSISQFLTDEFTICVVLAYDEIATTKAYQKDLLCRYPLFRSQSLMEWIKLVARDEAWHFDNAIEIINTNHSDRTKEIPEFLECVASAVKSVGEYGSTFVLDHGANDYDESLLASCKSALLRRVGAAHLAHR